MSLFLWNNKVYEGTREDVEAFLRCSPNLMYYDDKLKEVVPTPISSIMVQKLLEIEKEIEEKKEELNNLLSTFYQVFDPKTQKQ